MLNKIKTAVERINALPEKKTIRVISHYDTDGITSAAILSRALKRCGKSFSIQIVKGLDSEFIQKLPSDQLLIFLDIGSGSLNYLKEKNIDTIILDHHEIPSSQEIPQNVLMINPHLTNQEQLSGAALSYLFAKALSPENIDLANLAVIGMVGDVLDQCIGKTYDIGGNKVTFDELSFNASFRQSSRIFLKPLYSKRYWLISQCSRGPQGSKYPKK